MALKRTMKPVGLALALVAAVVGSANAQAPTTPPDPLLVQRVSEELAMKGRVLSRLGAELQIQPMGDEVVIALVDPATGRALSSSRVSAAWLDDDAAVERITQIATSLVDALAPAHSKSSGEMITFVKMSSGWWGSISNVHAPVLGTAQTPLGETEFFEMMDRPDLADAYRVRRRNAAIGLALSSATVLGGIAYLAWLGSLTGDERHDGEFNNLKGRGGALGFPIVGVGVIGVALSTYFLTHPLSSRTEVYRLANAHNDQVRALRRAPVGIAPYATSNGGGVAVGGAF